MPARTRVLVVVRNLNVRRKLATTLGRAGYDVFQAEDRTDGLPLLYEAQPDLIFLDVTARPDDTWETFSRIRLLTDTPIILLADRPPRETDQSLEEQNAFALLQPLSSKAVLTQAKAVLRRSHACTCPPTATGPYPPAALGVEAKIPPERLSWLMELLSKSRRSCTPEHIVDPSLLDHARTVSNADWIALYSIPQAGLSPSSRFTFELFPPELPWSEAQVQFMQARMADAVQARQVLVGGKSTLWHESQSACDPEAVGLGSFAVVPLIDRERVHGALAAVKRAEPSRVLGPEQIQFIYIVAEAVALGIDNVWLAQQRSAASLLDATTQIYGHAYLDQIVAAENRRCERYGRPFALVRIDWLNFQEFCEARGGRACMETLSAMANLIRKHLRAADIVARYGDRAIALFLPETNSAGGQCVAARIMQLVQASFANDATGLHPVVAATVERQRQESYPKMSDGSEPELAPREGLPPENPAGESGGSTPGIQA